MRKILLVRKNEKLNGTSYASLNALSVSEFVYMIHVSALQLKKWCLFVSVISSMDWVTFLVVVMLLLLLCSLQSEMGQLEEQVDQQAHKIQRYKVYKEYMERVLEHSGEVIIIYCILRFV